MVIITILNGCYNLEISYHNLYIIVIITILNGCYKLEEGVHCGGQINPWKLCKQTCVNNNNNMYL